MAKLNTIFVSGRLLSFYFGGSKLVIFLAKIEQIPRILLYFVNRHHARSSKCAKIGLSKIIFNGKKHLNLSNIDFHLFFLYFTEFFRTSIRAKCRYRHYSWKSRWTKNGRNQGWKRSKRKNVFILWRRITLWKGMKCHSFNSLFCFTMTIFFYE